MFDNFITIEPSANSVYSLRDINITLDDLNAIVGSDYANGEALGNAKIDFAYRKIADEILTKLNNGLRTSSILDNERVGYRGDDNTLLTPIVSKMKGVFFEFERSDLFLKFSINAIRLSVEDTGTYDVEIWDFQKNTLLDTVQVEVTTANAETIVPVNLSYSASRDNFKLGVIYNPSGTRNVKTTVKSGGCLNCVHIGTHRNIHLNARAIEINEGASKLKSNVSFKQETGGISLDYTLDCDYYAWLASNRSMLGLAILYKVGFEIADFAYNVSTRTNSRTNIDSEKWNQRQEVFNNLYMEKLASVTNKLRLPSNMCFCGRPQISIATML